MADQDIINLIREQIDAQGAGDDNRLGATVTDDYVYNEFGSQRRVQGRQAWVELWQGWRQAFPDVKGTVQNVFVSGNQALAEVTWDGTLQGDFGGPGGTISANGKRMQELRVAFVYTAEGAKLKEVNVYFEIAGLIQQISP